MKNINLLKLTIGSYKYTDNFSRVILLLLNIIKAEIWQFYKTINYL